MRKKQKNSAIALGIVAVICLFLGIFLIFNIPNLILGTICFLLVVISGFISFALIRSTKEDNKEGILNKKTKGL